MIKEWSIEKHRYFIIKYIESFINNKIKRHQEWTTTKNDVHIMYTIKKQNNNKIKSL